MRSTVKVVESPLCVVRLVECREHHARWSPVESAEATQIVLVRRGRFRLCTDGSRTTMDPTRGYLQIPGQEARFAHPAGGDTCTSITLPDPAVIDGIATRRDGTVPVDAQLELAHRLVLGSHEDRGFGSIEAVLRLLELAVRREPGDTPAPGRRALAERARDAILADDPAGASLVALARLLSTSPSHLSRTFRHHAGMSLSRFRNRVRVSRALQRLDDGQSDLARLAVTLGFSDQAHLTRVMRRELGATPRHVRRLLTV